MISTLFLLKIKSLIGNKAIARNIKHVGIMKYANSIDAVPNSNSKEVKYIYCFMFCIICIYI